jgi:hypothetical protein
LKGLQVLTNPEARAEQRKQGEVFEKQHDSILGTVQYPKPQENTGTLKKTSSKCKANARQMQGKRPSNENEGAPRDADRPPRAASKAILDLVGLPL